MSRLVLGPLFTQPLHRRTYDRTPARDADDDDYRVTGQYADADRINKSRRHEAVDAGNFGENDPLLAPAACRARGLWHFDGALGVEFELGGGWTLEAWHLNRTLKAERPVGNGTGRGEWTDVTRGQQVGTTGSTGRVTGAHTHIELKHDGVRVDPEPHLFGRPIEGASDDTALFSDVADSVHRGSIERVAGLGLLVGYADGTYRPGAPLSRGAAATLVNRLLEELERAGVKLEAAS